jgi:ankyrin repeat protein
MSRRLAVCAAALLALAAAGVPARAQLNFNPFGAYWENVARSVAKNDAGAVQQLLTDGKSPNDSDDEGHAALQLAAISGNLGIATMLIKAGATIEIKDPLGDTPLFYAADRNHAEIVKLLLDSGAVPDDDNRSGVTPLMAAARHGNIEAVRLLLAKGADPSKTDYTGRDSVGWAEDSHKPAVVQLLRQAASTRRR